MTVVARTYEHSRDYDAVHRFLIEVYQPGSQLLNWLPPRWEYMHAHPFIANVPLDVILVFEDGGRIVGVAHPEHSLAFNYFQRAPGYDHILPQMFAHADEHFGGRSVMLQRDICGLFINDFDHELERLAKEHGYVVESSHHEGYSSLDLTSPIPTSPVAAGVRIASLAEENDHQKINRCLWRGFNREGEIPAEDLYREAVAQSAPNFRPELHTVAVTDEGAYVAYAGMWFVPEIKVGYVEPVATDPDYRMLGLGRACVLESLRRVREAGAELAWVGSDQQFYASLGFQKRFQRNLWVKELG